MRFLLKLITKISQCYVISPVLVTFIDAAWRDNKISRLLSFLVVSIILIDFCNLAVTLAAEPSTQIKPTKKLNKDWTDKTVIEPTDKEILCNKAADNIIFKPQTIFDENEDGIIFLHRWANAIHIKTKIITLENEATFFIKKCLKTSADMAELERHLRSRRYLKDAKVSRDKDSKKITITTWDNWSFLPTVSFGRKGGVNTYSFGIKERNLLGLGIDTELESYRNSQRSGYKLQTTIPLFQKQNTSIKLKFADNDDGQQRSVFLQKVFAGFDIETAYNIGFNEESRNDTIFQNDQDQSIFGHDIRFKEASFAWLIYNNNSNLLRYRLGGTQDKDTFSQRPVEQINTSENSVLTTVIPKDRDLLYPWFSFEYLEKDFRELTNVHLITQIEDFNHGWQINSRLGIGNGKKDNSAWTLWRIRVKKGFNLHNNALLLLDLALANDSYQHRGNRLLMTLNSEYFYRLNKTWGFYIGNANVISKNQYLDQPVTMGGNTGLRGFPLQYQHGENSVKVTSEIRYYPKINLFKLFDLAGVAFIDAGRAFGESTVKNSEDGWLGSIGLGLRLYSPHSSGNHPIIHIDFAFPQSDNPDINRFEMRIQAKKSF